MPNLSDIYARRHPICHDKWSTVVPADCENGDNIGKVSYLYTHSDFYSLYWPYATPLTSASYGYEIVGGNSDGAFAIDSNGELTVANASNFTATRDITVRVKVFDWYFNDCVCTIRRIPVEDCIYFDFNVSAGQGDGTRSSPYRSFADRESVLGNGQAGKSYFWRRGRTYLNEWSKIWQSDINADFINFAAWGQGTRPLIDLKDNLTSQRFVDIGTSLEGTWEANTCHNFRMYDFEFTHDMSSTVFPVNGNPYGQNWEIHRIKCENTTFTNGFLWFIGVFSVGFVDKNLEISDIQTSNSTSRQVKFECGGVKGWNFKCHGETGGALISATTHPFVELKYVHYTNIHTNTEALHMNLRARGHSVEWAVFEVTGWPMVLFNLGSSDGQGADYNIDDSCYFRNIIVNYCDGQSLNHSINQTSQNTINGARFENIYSRTNRPMWSNGTAENLKFRNVFLKSTITYGIRVWASSGGNATPTIDNCTILGFTNPVHCESGMEATLRNSVYDGTPSGTVHETTNSTNISDFQDVANDNYRIDSESNLIGAGTDLEYDFDIVQADRPTSPTLGAFEYVDEPLDLPKNLEVDPKLGNLLGECNWDDQGLDDWDGAAWSAELDTRASIYDGTANVALIQEPFYSPPNALRMRGLLNMAYEGKEVQSNQFIYTQYNEAIFSFRMRLPQRIDQVFDGGDYGFINLIQFKGVNLNESPPYDNNINRPLWVLYLNTRGGKGSGGKNYLELLFQSDLWGDDIQQPQYLATPLETIDIPDGGWFEIQVRYKKGETDGIIQVWQDKTLLFNEKNVNTDPSSVTKYIFQSVNMYGRNMSPTDFDGDTLTQDTVDIYLDDVTAHEPNPEYDFGDELPIETAKKLVTLGGKILVLNGKGLKI